MLYALSRFPIYRETEVKKVAFPFKSGREDNGPVMNNECSERLFEPTGGINRFPSINGGDY